MAVCFAGQLVDELELKPTQPSTTIRLGLEVGLSLAKIERLFSNDVFKHCVDDPFLNLFKQT